MFSLLNQYSQGRLFWFFIFFGSGALFITSLYFQHYVGLLPCTLCIYQRCAILAIFSASLIGLYRPHLLLVRLMVLLIWLVSAAKGFQIALAHARLQFEPNFFDTCSINVEFPNWLPLNTWLPSVFNAYGFCADKIWTLFTIEMSQWMLIIFAGYFVLGMIFFISQFFDGQKKSTAQW